MARKGIPTEYNGIRFRSRLEATWAAFFDLMGWRWVYEPTDLNGYIPDFFLRCHANYGSNVVVEVKPASSEAEFLDAIGKIKDGGWCGSYVVVGLGLMSSADFSGDVLQYPSHDPIVGVGNIIDLVDQEAWNKEKAKLGGRQTTVWDAKPDTIHISGCGVCGAITPFDFPECLFCTARFDGGTRYDAGLIESAFSTAKNRTQWKGGFGG